MNKPIILRDLIININKENVLRFIDCYPDSPVYDEVVDEYERIIEEMYALCRPVTLLKFEAAGEIASEISMSEDTQICYGIFSIGNEISDYSTKCFQEGEYLAGLLSDAIANEALVQLDILSQNKLKEECAKRSVGVARRLEAPDGMPMEMQKVILEKTQADKILGINLTKGLMYTTVKTNGFLCELTDDMNIFKAQHDCSVCSAVNCKMRLVNKEEKKLEPEVIMIDVDVNGYTKTVQCKQGETLLECLRRNKIKIAAYCSGRGTCGKCKIMVVDGILYSTPQEMGKLSEQELMKGIHLACLVYPKAYCHIRILQEENEFDIVSTSVELNEQSSVFHKTDTIQNAEAFENIQYSFAIDIGTTTLAISLIDAKNNQVVATYTAVNSQRSFGADVISRIVHSNEGKGHEMQSLIRNDLEVGMKRLIEDNNIDIGAITDIAIAGNTTMQHLLLGYTCEGLGVSPFEPVDISYTVKSYEEVFQSEYLESKVHILPGFSTFVGADITAGMAALGFSDSEEIQLLVDLGTNGEMALGNKDNLLVTSTAAGPAFEGGNISCGTGSIPGAISSISSLGNQVRYETIQGKAPIGLCGTGVLEITAELIKAGLVDETGLLEDEYFDDGYLIVPKSETGNDEDIRFTQKDIREIQLAKAAVRGGIETLIAKHGCSMDQITRVYLAGGFGTKMNIEKAVFIGLFPKELQNKIKAVGNSSLAGAIRFIYDETMSDKMNSLITHAKEMNLANEPVFQDAYIESMYFTDDLDI